MLQSKDDMGQRGVQSPLGYTGVSAKDWQGHVWSDHH
jgi:hypothetical protein